MRFTQHTDRTSDPRAGAHLTQIPLFQIHETIESINQLKTQRDFMLSFSTEPQDFIQEWLRSQRRDLKVLFVLEGYPMEHTGSKFFYPMFQVD